MLPKSHRLPSFTIRDVMHSGRRILGNGITLIYCNRQQETSNNIHVSIPMSPVPCSRFTFIVSTKVDTRAVVRNRMRRVMSESVRHVYPMIHTPTNCVVIGSKGLVGLSQSEVQTRISDVLRKAHLLNTDS